MTRKRRTEHKQGGKASFDHVYDRPDPRDYFRALRPVEYQAPAQAAAVFARLVALRRRALGRERLVVLDLCSSYGVNAALLNHRLTLDDLYERYTSPGLSGLATGELAALDRAFYAERRRPDPVHVVGLDVSANAVAYARSAGLHWRSSHENLEAADPSEGLARTLAQVDLITVTGGIGYIQAPTFERVFAHARSGDPPWVAAFALRWVDYDGIVRVLAAHGLETERLAEPTFRQRRFADADERGYALAELERRGIDPAGKESAGWYHSALSLSAPVDPGRPALDELITGRAS